MFHPGEAAALSLLLTSAALTAVVRPAPWQRWLWVVAALALLGGHRPATAGEAAGALVSLTALLVLAIREPENRPHPTAFLAAAGILTAQRTPGALLTLLALEPVWLAAAARVPPASPQPSADRRHLARFLRGFLLSAGGFYLASLHEVFSPAVSPWPLVLALVLIRSFLARSNPHTQAWALTAAAIIASRLALALLPG